MANTIPPSRSFGDFYLDGTLTGHIFLKPSILVGDTCQWIFSELQGKGCDAVSEVISRIVLAIIITIIAPFAALAVPFGLVCKGFASLCSPPIPEEISPIQAPK